MKNLTGFILYFLLIPLWSFAQWTDNVEENTVVFDDANYQLLPKVVTNPSNGESFISWFSTGTNYQFAVFMQRLDADGNKLWADDGLLISDHPTMTWVTDYDLKIDNDGNAILATQDLRTGNSNVFAYKISANGDFIWGDDGIGLSNTGGFNPSPKAVILDDNSAIFGWEHEPSGQGYSEIMLQKLAADGTASWADYTAISNDSMHCLMPYFLKSDNNSVIAAWVEVEHVDTAMGNWPNMYIYAQKISSDGNFMWDEKVAVDDADNMPLKPFMPSLTADGSGGFVIAWMAFPLGPNYSCYIQHIDANGQPQWTPNGINVSDSVQFHHTYPKVAYLPDYGETFVFWNELREIIGTGVMNAIFGQKFNLSGEPQWQSGGMMFDGMYQVSDTLIILQNICQGRPDEITLFFEKEFLQIESSDNLIMSRYHAMKINRDGQMAWNPGKPLISNAPSNKLRFGNSALVGDQWVLVWADNRNDPAHSDLTGIYAQNLHIDGGAGPTAVDDFLPVHQESITAMPNPFSNSVLIRFEVPDTGSVKIDLYSMDGSLVCNVTNSHQSPGISSVELETSNLAKGMYFLRMENADGVSMHKIIK
ncbi:MAG: T9SS type A sorting domain-containing protein [Bacteroidales bacterium]|nr:T9SS type A sorting domain-containing protein [Bacteroidales bacterium]